MSDGVKHKMPQKGINRSKFRVDTRPSDTAYQHTFKTPQLQGKLISQAAQVIQLPDSEQHSIETVKHQQHKVKKSDEKKSKSSLKDKLDLISKQLLEKRLQESLVDSAAVIESETPPGNSSTAAADSDSTNSPSRTRSRKQGAPKAMRKPSSSEITSMDSSNVVNV